MGFLFLSLGDTDELAHRNDYAGHLEALQFADRVIGEIADTLRELHKRGIRTLLIVTTDHGRARSFVEHGRKHPESAAVWLMASGDDVRARGCIVTEGARHLADIAPTVRELDGLALSSRNTYLTPDDRRTALALSRALRLLEQNWRGGEADPAKLQRAGMDAMRSSGALPEYCALVDEDLQPVPRVTARTVAVVAARVGKTRLLDNVVLGEGIGADPRVAP